MVLRTHRDLAAFGWQDGLGKAVKLWVVSTAFGNNTVTLTLYEFTGLYMRNAMQSPMCAHSDGLLKPRRLCVKSSVAQYLLHSRDAVNLWRGGYMTSTAHM